LIRVVLSLWGLALLGCSGPGLHTAPISHERGGQLRLVTFNVQRCIRGLEEVAQVIRELSPDVVALQEVDHGTRRSGGADQAAQLARLTGLAHHVFFPARELSGGGEYGLAVLSRHPIRSTRQFPLPNWRGVEPRTLGQAIVEVEGQELSVYVTHLAHLGSRERLRALQARKIAALMSRDERAKVIMGDLNDSPASAPVQLIGRPLADAFALSGEGTEGTYPLPGQVLPPLRLDYIFASRELRPRRSFVAQRRASDHLAVVADVDLASQAASLVDRSVPRQDANEPRLR
jgi:endonuclease/exonuclease/phosphatase family metal-dependent hydrolase